MALPPCRKLLPDQHGTTFGGAVNLDDTALADGDKRAARRKDRFVLVGLKSGQRSHAARQAMLMATGKIHSKLQQSSALASVV